MARRASRYPTELELKILKILWRLPEASAQQVREELAAEADRDLARTTVVTTLNIMVDKKLAHREQRGKAFAYSARAFEREVSSGMLNDILNRVFDGSAEALFSSLLESEQVSDEEHKALRRLVNRRIRDRKGESK